MTRKKQPTQTMKAPDLFRDSYQTFDKKTGERVSYNGEDFDLFQYQTLIELPHEDPKQTVLIF